VDESVYAFPRGGTDLQAAMRRARIEEAERSSVAAELRGAELARLEMLKEALAPVLAQVPEGVDLFDVGIVPGERPRLFVDMIAFVEMARDRRAFRFVQETRSGRILLAEGERLEPLVEAVTLYIGRRLVEREKALAAELVTAPAAPPPADAVEPAMASGPAVTVTTLPSVRPRSSRHYTPSDMLFVFLIGVLAGVVGVYAWNYVQAHGMDLTSLWRR
jgi:hypothetical protein